MLSNHSLTIISVRLNRVRKWGGLADYQMLHGCDQALDRGSFIAIAIDKIINASRLRLGAGKKDYRQFRIALFQGDGNRGATHLRHFIIRDDGVHHLGRSQLQTNTGTSGCEYAKTVVLENRLVDGQGRGVVIDPQHGLSWRSESRIAMAQRVRSTRQRTMGYGQLWRNRQSGMQACPPRC